MDRQCIFPAELIREILSCTGPLDVVRWRTVSKWFSSITHDPKIWKDLYANSHFLRPPGPFRTAAFERAFVKSARLERSWTTQGLRVGSRASFPFEGRVTGDKGLHLVGGRWLVVCQSNRRFVLYDTNIDGERREPQVIWEQTEDIGAWDKCVATSEEGQWILYVLLSLLDDLLRWTLLEFRLDAESGALCETTTLDVPVSNVDQDHELGPPKLDGGQKLLAHSRFLSISSRSLIFDTQTRLFYEFPKFSIGRDTTRRQIGSSRRDSMPDIVPTNTHIIVVQTFFEPGISPESPCRVVQAFAVPHDPPAIGNGKGILRLSHEGVFFSKRMIFAIIRNSVVDPTGIINVKLLERDWKYDGIVSTCISLMLDKPSSNDVSPIFIDRRTIDIKGDISFDDDDDDLDFCTIYYDISDDGYAKGLFVRCDTTDSRPGIVKFSIDATQDRCVAVLGELWCEREWDDIMSPIDHHSHYASMNTVLDCLRGRLSYIDKDEHGRRIENASVVVVGIE